MGEPIDEAHLISKVEQYPMIYDQQNRHYSDKEKKEAVWKEIGAALRFPASECRIKWQTLRGSFRRAHKLVSLSKSGQSAKKRKLWRWYDLMAFLVPFMDDGGANLSDEENSVYGNINDNDEMSETTEFSADAVDCSEEMDSSDAFKANTSANAQIKNKPEKNRVDVQSAFLRYFDNRSSEKVERPKKNIDNEALKAFFQCMYETVRSFPPQYQTKAKCAVFQAVSEIETQLHNLPVMLNQNNIPQHLFTAMTSGSGLSPTNFQHVQESTSSTQPNQIATDTSSFNHSNFESKLDVFNIIDSKDVTLENSISLSDSPVKLEEN